MAEDGVTIEFLSRERLTDEESFEDKLDFVLDKVKENAVLVLEEAWLPEEKRELIQKSVEEADEDFPGVEFMGFNAEESRIDKMKSMFYDRFLNEQYRRGLTIVGNSRVMEKIKEEPDTVSFLAKMEEES
ncbi:MAG: DUF2073 domain-containing protein [Candidatus Nanohaloarchaea archaeon]